MDTISVTPLRTFVRVYPLLKCKRLSPNIKSALHKALFMSVMTYAPPPREFWADTYHFRLQNLQNKVCRIIGNFSRRTSTRELRACVTLLRSQ
jgi:hypothetical protein